ncbi:MAG: DUF1177 domain-containing protein [Ardenticatenaceae bacterium]
MALKQTIEAYELLDQARVSGEGVAGLLRGRGLEVGVTRVDGERGGTEFVRVLVAGRRGKQASGDAPTLGIIGKLGGIGARPTVIGLVSDADGAITALACALKLADMVKGGDRLPGDVIITTHICPNAPIIPHDPVPFMSSPLDSAIMKRHEVDSQMDAILSVDTTRGNLVINRRGFAISPTVKEGYILKVSPDLLRIMAIVTGQAPAVLPITTQDITPYGNGIEHINSIMQPSTATNAPVVGVALTAETPVPGCASGASQIMDIEMAVRFCLEVAKAFGQGKCPFYDAQQFKRLVALYGSMNHLQTLGKA